MSPLENEGLELSPQQRRIWRLADGPGPGRVRRAFSLPPEAAVRVADRLEELVERHEILRTGFQHLPGMRLPVQVVRSTGTVDRVTRRADAGRETELGRFLEGADEPAFDATGGPVLRVVELPRADGGSDVVLSLPALCGDPASLTVLGRFLGAEAVDGKPGEAEEPLQYADLAAWLNELQVSDEAEEGRDFWRRTVRRADRLRIPGETLLPPGQWTTTVLPLEDSGDLVAGLEEHARRLGVPVRDLVLTLWWTLLARLSGSREFVTGVIAHGRSYAELEGAVGALARVLPLPLDLVPSRPWSEAAQNVSRLMEEALAWQDCFAWSLLPRTAGDGEGGPVIRFQLEEQTGDGAAVAEDAPLPISDLEPCTARLVLATGPGRGTLQLRYASRALPRPRAMELGERLTALLEGALAAPEAHLGDLPLLTAAERRRPWIETAGGPAGRDPVHRLLEVARQRPDGLAVVYGGRHLTFGELDRRSGVLAARLATSGVGAGDLVALALDRSPETVVALVGVLRAGAAYVPLDLAQPPARIATLLEEIPVRAIVVDDLGAAALPESLHRRLPVPLPETAPPDAGHGPVPVPPESLAYAIFTSGSTGRPKAVGVERRNLSGYLDALVTRLGVEPGQSFAMVSTFAADLGHSALFPALVGGGTLLLVSEREATSPGALARVLADHPVDYLKIVPGHLEALLAGDAPARLLPRHTLILGGEACPRSLVERVGRLAPDCRVVNHYGPTEATVGATTLPWSASVAEETGEEAGPVPIGTPLPGYRTLVVDRGLQPLPHGVAGELLIGGVGVARGYLGRPGATAASFVPDPVAAEPGARAYRTGDRVRRNDRGDLEFLGRIDRQVKLRGFRVELGEVERTLAAAPGVGSVAVVLQSDGDGGGAPRLVAYLADASAGPEVPAVRAWLEARLPSYMVPAAFVVLPVLPRTPNGKVDIAALPVPAAAGVGEKVPPRTPVEKTLVEMWSDVLGRENLGIHDNFFGLGGDSILAIQVVAKAGAKGLSLTPLEMFRYQTIAELAPHVGDSATAAASRGPVAGPLPLMPIQRRFFDVRPLRPDHWNQSLMLEVRRSLEPAVLHGATAALLHHHDALRCRFQTADGGVGARIDPPGGPIPFSAIDLSVLAPSQRSAAAAVVADRVQRSLDLERGPVFRCVQLRWGDGADRLLFVVHHLVVDGVSWRILLEDLALVGLALEAGVPSSLPPRTASVQEWARGLEDLAGSGETEDEVPFWLTTAASPLPADRPQALALEGRERTAAASLEEEATRWLLEELPRRSGSGGARIHEALVAAVVEALGAWAEMDEVVLEMEGHGRDGVLEGLDVSRTVGWFTSQYPVLFRRSSGAGPAELVEEVRGRLAEVPRGGIGYGLLRYGDSESGRRLSTLPSPEVRFNYLGQVDRGLPADSPFAVARDPVGTERSPGGRRAFPLDVLASVRDGRLRIAWVYSPERFNAETVAALAVATADFLRRLVQTGVPEAATPEEPDTLGELSNDDMDRLLMQVGEAGD